MRNMLASLDNTIGAGTNGGNSFGSYSGAVEIVSVSANQFLAAGGWTPGNTSVTGVSYPDTATYPGIETNVYRSSSPGAGNYVVNSAARNAQVGATAENGINGNDVQFEFPFYAYILDPNNSVHTAGDGSLNGDETIIYGGLLISGAQWTRVNPAGASYKTFATLLANAVPAIPSINQKTAAGYYVSTTVGGFGGCVVAGYGQAIPSLTFDNRDGAVNFECIAHWPTTLAYGASPATVRWSLYPAHGVNDVNNSGHYYGERSSFFTKWITDTDIDPSVTPPVTFPGTQGPAPKRNNFSFNTSDFNYVGALGLGRVADFNYGTIKGWDGDIDRDNVRGEDGISVGALPDDKFPARCRIFTNFAKYLGYQPTNPAIPSVNLGYGLTGFPDNLPDPSSFVEGGLFLVDKGPAITKVSITDDPAKTDPKDNVTSPSANIYDVKLGFVILYGDPNFKVEYNPDFPGAGVWAVIPGNPPNATDPMDPILGYPNNGSHFPTVRVTQPVNGDYNFSVRVTDLSGAGDLSAVYTWPNKVPLKPPFKSVVFQDPQDLGGGKAATNLTNDLQTIYGSGTVDPRSPAQISGGLPAGSLDNYDVIAWPADHGPDAPANFWQGFNLIITAGPGNINLKTVKDTHRTQHAAVLIFGEGAFGSAAAWSSIFAPPNFDPNEGCGIREIMAMRDSDPNAYWQTYAYSGAYPDPFPGIGYNIFGPIATTPNTVGNLTGIIGGPTGQGNSWTAWPNFGNFLKNQSDPVNYPAGNCGFFSSAWYTSFGQTYICGSYARREVATNQALVSSCINWGDLLTAQGTKTRAHVLENMLCAGLATSRYNAPGFS
jgi:hypothetical protein